MGEFYEVSKNTSTSYSNRYKNCKLLRDLSTGYELLSTRESLDISEHPNDLYHRVASNEVGRLDIIASKYYRNPLFWWIIAEANSIYDPFVEVPSGTLLRIPAIESLYGNRGVLL